MNKKNFWYQRCTGERGKNIYLISSSFWNWINTNKSRVSNKRELVRKVLKLTNNEITQRAIETWLYHNRKPFIIDDKEIPKTRKTENACVHGYRYFCPLCKIKKEQIQNCPIPTIWTSDKKGKTYIYEDLWKELYDLLVNGKKIGVLQQKIAKTISIDQRELRRWAYQKIKPKIYTKEEFEFNSSNLYWLGLLYSDGHLRKNGSHHSYSYQTHSSNIFQGYWYPQTIQKFSPLFKHKEKESTTYIDNKNSFKTNLSGLSPIFTKFLEGQKLLNKRKNTKTSGFQKVLTNKFLKNTKNKEIIFQGIFDGDGSAKKYHHSFTIDLALEPNSNIYSLIQNFSLVPTLAVTTKRKGIQYHKNLKKIYSIRLAPTSINKLSQDIYSAKDIVNQLEFMLKSAQHSIRPDKVHGLIKIIQIIYSKKYGENYNSLPIQKEIRNLANERNLNKKLKQLETQYPIKNNKYLPFQPLWAKKLCSKKEWFSKAWDFFFSLENLNLKNYPNKEKFNFEKGIPVDFKL